MILIFGIELLKKYLRLFSSNNICFYDDCIKEYFDALHGQIPFFKKWDPISLVIITEDFLNHQLFEEVKNRKIPYKTDISLFLNNNVYGIKIGVIGNNYKSSFLYLVKYILGDLCSVSKKLEESPLDFPLNTFYIIEISDDIINLLTDEDFSLFDMLVFTDNRTHDNIEYSQYHKKFKGVYKIFYSSENLQCPDNTIFQEYRYQLAWNLLKQFAIRFKFNFNYLFEKLRVYSYVRFKREIIHEHPLIINDSNSTTVSLLFSSMNCMKSNFVLICNDFSIDIDILKQMLKFNYLKKIFLLSNKNIKFFQCESYVSDNFEILVQEAFNYAKSKNYHLLFSPGGESFKYFVNFEERGEKFNYIIEKLIAENRS